MEKRGQKHTLSESDTSSEEEDSSSVSLEGARKQPRLSIDLDDRNFSDTEDGGSGWDVANAAEQTKKTGGLANNSNYSSFAQRMMKNMGYQEGKGLGKYGQGLVDPVEASRQRGRRGLGLRMEGLEASTNLNWDSSQEHVQVEEEVVWLPQCPNVPPDFDTLLSWSQDGKKKLDISDETNFCDPKILEGVLKAKCVFDQLDGRELQRGRSRSNPFETLGKLFFQNRAALKMANMDAIFDYMFTRPKNEAGVAEVFLKTIRPHLGTCDFV